MSELQKNKLLQKKVAASKWFGIAKQKGLAKASLFCLCLCPQDTTSFCNFSCKHHFEHSENIVVRETDTKRSCLTTNSVTPYGVNDVMLRINSVLVGDGGFEPPKALPADLQSVPFGHSGNLP